MCHCGATFRKSGDGQAGYERGSPLAPGGEHDAFCRQQEAQRRHDWLQSRILHERHDMERSMWLQERCMRAEYQDYVGRRMRTVHDHYAPLPPHHNCRGCEHCVAPRTSHDDADIRRSSAYAYNAASNMYRTRSDETLSVSSSHPSRRHWKIRSSKSRSIRQLKAEGGRGVEVRQPPQGQVTDRAADTDHHAAGRSPEGQSSGNDYVENQSYLQPARVYSAGPGRTGVATTGGSEPTRDKLHRPEQPQTNQSQPPAPVAQPTRPAPQLPPKPQLQPQSFYAGAAAPVLEKTVSSSASYSSRPEPAPAYNTPNSSYNTTNCSSSRLTTSGSSYVLSPDQVQVHHSKTDSGSQPDSGYGSKRYTSRSVAPGAAAQASNHPTAPPANSNTSSAPAQTRNGVSTAGTSRATAPMSRQHPMPMVPPQHSRYPGNQQAAARFDNGAGPASGVQRNRGYASDGCPGMRRPKPDAYASDSCSGMRYPKSAHQYHRSVLSDWFDKHQARNNPTIREVPSQPHGLDNGYSGNQPSQNSNKPLDFWPGKATQV